MWIRSHEDWEKIRARGRTRFLLMAGVVGRGLPMGLTIAIAIEILTGRPVPESLGSARFLLTALAAVAVFSISGCLSAATSWRLAEKRFGEEGSDRGS